MYTLEGTLQLFGAHSMHSAGVAYLKKFGCITLPRRVHKHCRDQSLQCQTGETDDVQIWGMSNDRRHCKEVNLSS